MKKPTVAAAYLRMSKDAKRGGVEDLGLDRQRDICKKLAKTKGWQISEWYTETHSATKGVRPEFTRLLEDIAEGKVHAVICVDQDRFVRSMTETAQTIALCEKMDCMILLNSGEIDTTSADGILKAHILGAVADNEGRKKSERQKRENDQAALAGKPNRGGRRPFGWNEDRVTLHKKEAPAYRQMFDWAISGVGCTTIGDRLFDMGFTTDTGGRYGPSQVRNLLLAPRAVGKRVHRGEILSGVDGEWEPIVTVEKQEAARAALKTRRRQRSSKRSRRPARLLSSLVICDKCGQTMRVRDETDRKRPHLDRVLYKCDRGPHSCKSNAIKASIIEPEVEAKFLALMTQPKTHKALEKIRRQAPDTRSLLEEIEALKLDLEALAVDYGNGDLTRAEWDAARKGKTERLKERETELERVATNPVLLAASPQEIVRRWGRLDLDERRQRLAPYIDNVRVLGRSSGNRVVIAWRV